MSSNPDSKLQLAYIGATLVASTQEVMQDTPDPEWFNGVVGGVPLHELVQAILIVAHAGDVVSPVALIRHVRGAGKPWSKRLTTEWLQTAVEAHNEMGGIISEYVTLIKERWMAIRVGNLAQKILTEAANGEDYRKTTLELHRLATDEDDKSALRGDVALDRYVESWKGQRHIRVFTGISALDDDLLFISEGDLATIGARSSNGKTVLAVQIALATAERGTPVVYYSSEMTRENIAIRMAAQLANLNFGDLVRGRLKPYESGIKYAKEKLAGLPIALIQTNRIDEVLVDMSRRFASGRSRVAIVDFVQDFRGHGKDEYTVLSAFIKDMKALAQRFDGIVVGTAQINRGTEHGGKSRPPRKSDLKGTGTFEETSDQIVLLWRQPDEGGILSNYGEIIVDKQRNGAIGKVGVIFDPVSLSFSTL